MLQKPVQIRLRSSINLVDDDDVGQVKLVEEHVGVGHLRVRKIRRVRKADRRSKIQHTAKPWTTKRIKHFCGMSQPCRLNQHSLRTGSLDQFGQTEFDRSVRRTTKAAAGDFTDGNFFAACRFDNRTIDADFAELIDQDRPAFARWFLADQMSNRGRLSYSEKARNQVRGNQRTFGHGDTKAIV